ncbi:MAG: PilZ domain-containing protein [Proteobacteria bacterium]|nr:PilZ domain-containing protein [Pseudomonadota bacterium]
MIERRIDRRIPFRTKVIVEADGIRREFYTINISRGGVYIETDNPLTINSIISLEIAIDENTKIDLQGKVVWVSYPHRDSNYLPGMGVKFMDISAEKMEILGNFIGDYIKKNMEIIDYTEYSLDDRIVLTDENIYEQNAELLIAFAGLGIKELINHTKYVLDNGGEQLRLEYEKRGDLLPFEGSFQVTAGGNLMAKYVLFTAIPNFYDSYGEELLRISMLEVLNRASLHCFSSVFYPAFSLLEAGFPINVSAKVLLGTTYGFLKKEKFPVKVIFFCNNQDLMVFQKIKREIFES